MRNSFVGQPVRLLGVILLVLLVIGVFPAALVLAHATLVRSEPAAGSVLQQSPGSVNIWFTEAVDPHISHITVQDSQGKQIDNGDSAGYQNDPTAVSVTLPNLPDGEYTVVWKSFSSTDGHSMQGSFVFSVGAPLSSTAVAAQLAANQPSAQSPLEIALRWLGLLSILTIAGCLAFEAFITRPILAAEGASRDMQDIGLRTERRTLNVVWWAAALFLFASICELVVTTSVANNIPLFYSFGSPVVQVIQSGWGRIWLWRVIFAVTIIVTLVTASLEQVTEYRAFRGWQVVALVFAAGALFTISMASHGAALTETRASGIFSDYLHLLAASVLVGGVFYFALVIPPVMKAKRKEIDSRQVENGLVPVDRLFWPEIHMLAISRFSTLAVLSVGTLFITGLYSSWAQVTELRALATPYGAMLVTKLGFAVPLVLLGAVNLLYVRPRLGRDAKALRVLQQAVTAEAVLAALVLLCVAILVGMQPARQAASLQEGTQQNRFVSQNVSEGTHIKTVIEPSTLGSNLVAIYLTDQSGKPIINATVVTLKFTYLDKDTGSIDVPVIDQGKGVWTSTQAVFSVLGHWQANVVAQIPGAFDARTSFSFQIPFSAIQSTIVLSAQTGKRLWGVEMLFLGLLFGGVAISVRRWWARAVILFISLGIVSTIAGLIVLVITRV